MKIKISLLSILFMIVCVGIGYGQSINKISTKCPSPSLLYDSVFAKANGNIYYDPCAGFSSIFSGIVDFSGATVILPGGGSPVSGTGTTNFVPRWTNGAAGVLGNTPFSWNATQYVFNNTALNGTWLMSFRPSSAGVGTFNVGAATTSFAMGESTGAISLLASGNLDFNTFGTSNINGRFSNSTSTFTIESGVGTNASFELTGAGGGQLTAKAGNGIILNSKGASTQVGDVLAVGNGTTFNLDDTTSITTITANTSIALNSKAGTTGIGDINSVGNETVLAVDDTARTIDLTTTGSGIIRLDSATGSTTIGDVNTAANRTRFILTDSARTFAFGAASNLAVMDWAGILNYLLNRTITAGGTTGNQVINKPNGTINFAAAATTILITNSVADANSTIFITPQRLDATCVGFTVTSKGAGSFRISTPVACTAETAVAFLVLN